MKSFEMTVQVHIKENDPATVTEKLNLLWWIGEWKPIAMISDPNRAVASTRQIRHRAANIEKVREAERLLREGKINQQQIAAQVGFSSRHISRIAKRMVTKGVKRLNQLGQRPTTMAVSTVLSDRGDDHGQG